MNVTIAPGKIHGQIPVPPSKYIAHRAIFMASLTHGASVIRHIPEGDDVSATINTCRQLGARITRKKNQLVIQGTRGIVGAPARRVRTIHCGESGTTLRFVTALACATQSPLIIDGGKRLRERPITELVRALQSIGVQISTYPVGAGFISARSRAGARPAPTLPLFVQPSFISKKTTSISGSESSQYISGLLMLAPLLPQGLTIHIHGKQVSKPYLDLTWNLLQQFGIHGTRRGYRSFHISGNQQYCPRKFSIEGDYASASYLLAGSVIAGSPLTVSHIPRNSMQPEKRIIPILKSMGAQITASTNSIIIKKKSNLKGTTLDMSTSPDLVPTVAALAAFAHGTTRLTHIDFLKHKESDRLNETARVLKAIGVTVITHSSNLTIKGRKPTGGTIDCAHDHRLAMSLAAAALGCQKPVTIRGAEAINKSWPDFFKVLKKLGARVQVKP